MGSHICIMFLSVKYTLICQSSHFQACWHRYPLVYNIWYIACFVLSLMQILPNPMSIVSFRLHWIWSQSRIKITEQHRSALFWCLIVYSALNLYSIYDLSFCLFLSGKSTLFSSAFVWLLCCERKIN